ncbi:MAG: M15 family metallopeptidase [Catalinimonas sp.]
MPALCRCCFLLLLLGCTTPTPREAPPAPATLPTDTVAAVLPAVERLSDYELRMRALGLVDVQTLDPTIQVELKYSTTDNFVGVDVYGDLDRAYLQPEPARRLVEAQRLLRERRPNLRLLVYDAARPRAVQQVLWDMLPKPEADKPKYVADPQKGSIHNFGAAVDLTIADTTGASLDMGTPYDYFGVPAFPYHEERLLQSGRLTQAQVDNRRLLREVMRAAGFSPITSEWWHFDAFSRAEARRRFPIVE